MVECIIRKADRCWLWKCLGNQTRLKKVLYIAGSKKSTSLSQCSSCYLYIVDRKIFNTIPCNFLVKRVCLAIAKKSPRFATAIYKHAHRVSSVIDKTFQCLSTRISHFSLYTHLHQSRPFVQHRIDVILAHILRSLLCRRPLPSLALAPPRARLSLISRHLENRPLLEINTPFSTERQSTGQDDVDYTPIQRYPPKSAPQEETKPKMSNQAEHPALLIPGPIEFDDAVLNSMGHFRCVVYFCFRRSDY